MKTIHRTYNDVRLNITEGDFRGKARIREAETWMCIDILLPMIPTQAKRVLSDMPDAEYVKKIDHIDGRFSLWGRVKEVPHGLKITIPYDKPMCNLGWIEEEMDKFV